MRVLAMAALALTVSGPVMAQDLGAILRDQVVPRLDPNSGQREREAYERGRQDQERARREVRENERRNGNAYGRDDRRRDDQYGDRRYDERSRDRAYDERRRVEEDRRRIEAERRGDDRRRGEDRYREPTYR